MDTKDDLESVEPNSYAQGYRDGVAAGKAEAEEWWAERWQSYTDAIVNHNDWSKGRELDERTRSVLND